MLQCGPRSRRPRSAPENYHTGPRPASHRWTTGGNAAFGQWPKKLQGGRVVTVLVRCSVMEVRVEALRLAREHVKKAIRRKGFNLYEVSAKEINKSAEALLAARPQVMIEQATHRFPHAETLSLD